MEKVDAPVRSRKTMKLTFPRPPRAGRVVVELKDVRFGYDARPVYESLDVALERDDKVALAGPNGAGKTTLLKLLAGVLQAQAGNRRLGHNVNLGYFAQHQIEALTPTNTVLQELRSAIPPQAEVDARKLLGRFLFSGDDAEKRVAILSGGERTRLALAKLLVSPVNLLFLDEPTNHLDMWSRDVLEDALQEYGGAIVLITHDRHLIRNVANRVIEVVNGRVTNFEGDYDYYLSKREDAEQKPVTPSPRKEAKIQTSGPKSKEQKRLEAQRRAETKAAKDKVRKIEKEMERLDIELKGLEETLAQPDTYMAGTDVAEISRNYQEGRRRQQALEAAWTDAMQSLEASRGTLGVG
ncbi:MAG: ABC-F family ATP-binding cassette domain-containing protein [Actinobacteria bacterium]|nr:ABC-F family ATP-binding cassette domain-containing protein [Actinomycetota bacterium]